MSNSDLVQIQFADPDGGQEILWAEKLADDSCILLNVPVHIYGVSVGTRVATKKLESGSLKFGRVLKLSPGGTVRAILPSGVLASAWYLNDFLPQSEVLGLGVGPATFFDPRMVAIHVQYRSEVWQNVGALLTELAGDGTLQQWEAVDPEENQDPEMVDISLRGSGHTADSQVLVHPTPTSASLEQLHFDRSLLG